MNCRVGVFAVARLNACPIGKEHLEACQLPLLGREVNRGVAVRALGVGKMRLLANPSRYNALSGFDLEVTEFIEFDDEN